MRFSLEWRENDELTDSNSFSIGTEVKRVSGAVSTKSIYSLLIFLVKDIVIPEICLFNKGRSIDEKLDKNLETFTVICKSFCCVFTMIDLRH